jgi:outer membrane lipoprotein-sorting protein
MFRPAPLAAALPADFHSNSPETGGTLAASAHPPNARGEVTTVKNSLRWLPAVIAPAIVVSGVIALPAIANAVATPPERTAQEVLALIADAENAAYSGTIEQTSDLGLPEVPKVGPGSSTGTDATSTALDLLAADHTARVFVDGPSKQRLQVLDTLAERNVIRNGAEVWAYDSKTKNAAHATLTAADEVESLTPAQLADKFIAAIEPSTEVAVTSTATVAGRAVYELELTPKSDATLIEDVTLSVDAETGVPLKIVVDARGQSSDAFSVGFRSIDFAAPDPSTFEFTPPPGAHVSTPGLPPAAKQDHPRPTIMGTGWDSIVVLPAAAAGENPLASVDARSARMLDDLTTPVEGGRALQTSLVSVLLLDDGRVLAGAVPIASLEAAAR